MLFRSGFRIHAETNVLVVANSNSLLFFDRLANGNVAPVGEIGGERTGIRDEPWELQIHKGKSFLAASNHLHQNLYAGVTIKPEYSGPGQKPPEDPWLNPELGFIGVWNVRDRGDVPPRGGFLLRSHLLNSGTPLRDRPCGLGTTHTLRLDPVRLRAQ